MEDSRGGSVNALVRVCGRAPKMKCMAFSRLFVPLLKAVRRDFVETLYSDTGRLVFKPGRISESSIYVGRFSPLIDI